MKTPRSSQRPSNQITSSALDRRSFLACSAATAGALLSGVSRAQETDLHDDRPVHYPDSRIAVLDPRFAKYKIGNTPVQRLWTGALWAEGCAWNGGGRYLLWSDIRTIARCGGSNMTASSAAFAVNRTTATATISISKEGGCPANRT